MKRLRRSMLFCPANNEKMLASAHLRKADCVIFDLEDAVSFAEKENARRLLCNALLNNDYGECEIFARINGLNTGFGKADVDALVRSGVKNIRLPMCESKDDIITLSQLLCEYEKANGLAQGFVKIQGAIETPRGVLNAADIASADKRVIAISFGAEDYTNCLGVNRTKNIEQFLYARSYISLVANAAGIDAIDTVFTDLSDIEGFKKEALSAKELGFSGKSCLHPQQVEAVNEVFTPTAEEIEKARKIVLEAQKAEENGLGVIKVDGKMVDWPIIKKAERILALAKMC